ncbi:hypothetical protein [Neolewinella antarctica]|uniref:Uncharacterized protein n=1 Tax=Neolewinella antarctica TaxID=442734 RepID=A0ABX0X7M9_9BACT|nr:hypothetical protein [Neolewinella antarctica]NJC25254.1 hypothetical protein [Neolewinella antarctica]
MKNQLEPWEVDLAEKAKAHEFAFDESAFTHFEQLFAAEAGVTGQQLVDPTTATATQAAATTAPGLFAGLTVTTILKVLFIAGIGVAMGILLTQYSGEVTDTPAVREETQVERITPATEPAIVLPGDLTKRPAGPSAAVNTPRIFAPVSQSTAPAAAPEYQPNPVVPEAAVIQSQARPAARLAPLIPYLPLQPLVIEPYTFILPNIQVQKLTPPKKVRDPNTLFPDVINN